MNVQFLKRNIIINLMFTPHKKGRKKIEYPQFYGLDEDQNKDLLDFFTGYINPFTIMDLGEGIFKKYCKVITNDVPQKLAGVIPTSTKNNPEIIQYIANRYKLDRQIYDSFFAHENIDQYIAIAFKKSFVEYLEKLDIMDINSLYNVLENSIFDRIF